MNTKYIYAGTPDTPGKWKCIPDTPEARAEAVQNGYNAFSIYSLDYEPEKGKAEPIRYGSLWIDVDCKKDPAKAILAVRAFVQKLSLHYAVDVTCLNFFLSGGKGMHIEIPSKLFGGCKGHTNLHNIHKTMVQRLIAHWGLADLKNSLIDESLYCGGKGKLLREPNIKRPDGKYKVPISLSELMDTEPYKLLEFTKNPRENFIRPEVDLVEGNLIYIYNFALNLWGAKQQKSNIINMLNGIQRCNFIEHCYQNQDTLSEPEWFKMVEIFAQAGEIARYLVHEYSLGYPNYTQEETDRKFNRALYSEYRITCANIKESYDCQRTCNVRSPADLFMKSIAKQEVVANCFTLKDDGVYYKAQHEDPSQAIRICSSLTVLGKMRRADGTGWSRLVELITPDGKQKKICIPMRECSGRGDSVKALLADCGLEITPSSKCGQLLLEYICYGGTDKLLLHATKTGWHDNTYVLPDLSFGSKREEEVFFENRTEGLHKTQGSLAEWQEQVGSLCIGNSLLVLTTSFAFTAPLLRQTGIEGGGLHIYGASSTGKTTCVMIAGSVCGGGGTKGYIRQWRSTDNALENTAIMHNDNLLVLDELGQAKSEAINNIAYMLANGQGRERMRADATSQKTRTWILNFLSTGELTVNDKIEETGKHKAMAGQSVRIIDLPIDKGNGSNLFTETHGYTETADLSAQLNKSCSDYYGTPLRAFLEQYCSSLEDVNVRINNYLDLYVENNTPPKAAGQVKRVLRKFALIAIAGELAIEWGILPYKKGDVEAATKEWFGIWVAQRGSVGELEVERVLEKIQEHFETEKGNYRSNFNNPLFLKGYKVKHDGKDCYFMTLQNFAALTKGIARSTMCRILKGKGWIALDKQGNPPDTKQTCDGSKRGIGFFPSIWEGESDAKKPCVNPIDYSDLF